MLLMTMIISVFPITTAINLNAIIRRFCIFTRVLPSPNFISSHSNLEMIPIRLTLMPLLLTSIYALLPSITWCKIIFIVTMLIARKLTAVTILPMHNDIPARYPSTRRLGVCTRPMPTRIRSHHRPVPHVPVQINPTRIANRIPVYESPFSRVVIAVGEQQ